MMNTGNDIVKQTDLNEGRKPPGNLNRFSAFTLLIFLLTMLSGCASLQPQEDRVRVTIADLRPLASTFMEQRYLVKIRLQNRSREALIIEGMSFDLDLNGRRFASGVSSQKTSIPGFSESTLEVKLSSTVFGLIRQISELQNRQDGSFDYEIKGSLSIPDSLFAIPFSDKGEIDLLPVTQEQMN
jgi:LEA14-like dessication related protein